MDASLYIGKRIIQQSSKSFTKIIMNIAIATIALSIVIMLCSNALINGFKEEISQKIFGFWGHIHITDTKMLRTTESIPISIDENLEKQIGALTTTEYVDESTMQDFTTNGGVSHIQPYAFVPGLLDNNKNWEGVILKGVNDKFNWDQMSSYLKEGSPISFSDSTASRDLIISQQTASRMNVGLGDALIVHFGKERKSIKKRFKICGIYKTELEEYDSKFSFVDLRIVQDVLDWNPNQISGYEVYLDDLKDASAFADIIYNEHLPRGLYTETIQEKLPNIFEWLELQNINETIIIFLMIIVSIINMATVILIFILDRSRMIGILKSIGSKNWTIRKIFLLQALWILIKGLIIGNIIALALMLIQKYGQIIRLDPESYYVSIAPVKIDLLPFLWINLLVIVVTLLWMVIPTYIITKIKPVKVLRFG